MRSLISLLLITSLMNLSQAVPEAEEIQRLETKISKLEGEIRSLKSDTRSLKNQVDDVGVILVFFAFFCALWAQNTGRNPWLWFFLGLFFHIITGFVLLYKNSSDKKDNTSAGSTRKVEIE